MIREYIYVKDSIDGYISLAENMNKTKGEAFNLASKAIMSVTEIVSRISKVLGKPIKMKILDQAKAEIPQQCLDGSKIKSTIGWEAKTNFEEAVKETFDWYKRIIG